VSPRSRKFNRGSGPELGHLNPETQEWFLDLRTRYKAFWRQSGKILPKWDWGPEAQVPEYRIGPECKFFLEHAAPMLKNVERDYLRILS